MQLLDLTFPDPQRNLSCDDALLEHCERHDTGDLLRFWEPARHFVVLGYSGHAAREVDLEACRARAFPVLRRCSGGGTVLQGPGCLNYALILRIAASGHLASITGTNMYVMGRHRDALAALTGMEIQVRGHTDLAAGELKFSGNAQRRAGRYLLFHGVFLLDFDISLMEQVLRLPVHQPAYRHGRSHVDFLTNLRLPAPALKTALAAAWDAHGLPGFVPHERIGQLAERRYAADAWNLRR